MSSPERAARKPRVTLLAIGTRGDVQPLAALGVGLRRAGFDVCVATHRSQAAIVQSRGLDFSLISPDPRDALANRVPGSGPEREIGWLELFRSLRVIAQESLTERVRSCWEACRDADLIVASAAAVLNGHHIAEKLDIPLVCVYFRPRSPTGDYPVWGRNRLQLGYWGNRLTHWSARQLIAIYFRSAVRATQREILTLSSNSRNTSVASTGRRDELILYGYSPSLYPRASDWSQSIQVPGFWFLDRPADWQPPTELVRFLDAGPPPVYVGFSSTPSREPRQMTEVVLGALRRLDLRALLASGSGGLANIPTTDQFLEVGDVPHEWLFPRMAAVVHHGGLGTTAEALRAGVPSVIVPLFPDQVEHGRRLHELQLGPPPLSRRHLTVDRLESALRVAVSDESVQRRVREIGERIRQEDGVSRAVEAIQEFLGDRALQPRQIGDRQLDAVE